MGAYPSFEQWEQQFPTEQHCVNFLEQLRWPNGAVCPDCRHRPMRKICTRRLPLYECSHCKRQLSLTSGTMFAKSTTPLKKWFTALFYMSSPAYTVNALQLQQLIGVTYKTAWRMLHQLRRALRLADSAQRLSGIVTVGIAIHGKPCSSSIDCVEGQHSVWIAASEDNEHSEQPIQVKIIPFHKRKVRPTRLEQDTFAMDYVDSCSGDIGFFGKYALHPRAKALRVIWKQARSWLVSTYRSIGSRHLELYFHEFCFKFNHRSCTTNKIVDPFALLARNCLRFAAWS